MRNENHHRVFDPGTKKKAQMKLSFGMIFSIILIIIFLVFAFYAIKTFLGMQSSAETGKFLNDLQSDINRIWRSQQASEEQEYSLPSKIEYICFIDFSISGKGQNSGFFDGLERAYYQSENLVFYPIGSSEIDTQVQMENIDIISIIQDENPFCIRNINGKTQVTLIKDFQDSLVTITR